MTKHGATGWALAELVGQPSSIEAAHALYFDWSQTLELPIQTAAHDVSAKQLGEWLESRRIGSIWLGCHVGAPIRQAASHHVDKLSKEAKRLGAINVIVRDGNALSGHNFDVACLSDALSVHGGDRGAIAIAGAGSATTAALYYAIDHGFHDIRVIARDPARMFDKLASRFAGAFQIIPCAKAPEAIDQADVVINATPMGSPHGAPLRRDILNALKMAKPTATVLDLAATHTNTQLLAVAQELRLSTVPGGVVQYQLARRTFAQLFNRQAPEPAREVLAGAPIR